MASLLLPRNTAKKRSETYKKSAGEGEEGKTFQIKLFYYFIADFNSDGKPDNITFMIKRIKVHNMNALKDPMYRFPGNYGVEKFLELFSGNCTCSPQQTGAEGEFFCARRRSSVVEFTIIRL